MMDATFDSQLVSAELSLFALMRSLRLSASRLAAAIRSWISVWFCDMLDAIEIDNERLLFCRKGELGRGGGRRRRGTYGWD